MASSQDPIYRWYNWGKKLAEIDENIAERSSWCMESPIVSIERKVFVLSQVQQWRKLAGKRNLSLLFQLSFTLFAADSTSRRYSSVSSIAGNYFNFWKPHEVNLEPDLRQKMVSVQEWQYCFIDFGICCTCRYTLTVNLSLTISSRCE